MLSRDLIQLSKTCNITITYRPVGFIDLRQRSVKTLTMLFVCSLLSRHTQPQIICSPTNIYVYNISNSFLSRLVDCYSIVLSSKEWSTGVSFQHNSCDCTMTTHWPHTGQFLWNSIPVSIRIILLLTRLKKVCYSCRQTLLRCIRLNLLNCHVSSALIERFVQMCAIKAQIHTYNYRAAMRGFLQTVNFRIIISIHFLCDVCYLKCNHKRCLSTALDMGTFIAI